MKKNLFFAVISMFVGLNVNAEPLIKSCLSSDGKVAVQIGTEKNENDMYEISIKSTGSSKPAEQSFPTTEVINNNRVKYFLLSSEFELLNVDLNTGKGKLSNGQFFSPNPTVDVNCEK